MPWEQREACTELLYREAELLDTRQYRAWLDLFGPEAIYWIPLREGQTDPENELNIVYDDRNRMEDRVDRLESGFAYAQEPPSRTARVIANVRVMPEDGSGALCVRSAFTLVEVRAGRQHVLGGHYLHRLGWVDGRLLILSKRADLVNSEEPLDNLTFLV